MDATTNTGDSPFSDVFLQPREGRQNEPTRIPPRPPCAPFFDHNIKMADRPTPRGVTSEHRVLDALKELGEYDISRPDTLKVTTYPSQHTAQSFMKAGDPTRTVLSLMSTKTATLDDRVKSCMVERVC